MSLLRLYAGGIPLEPRAQALIVGTLKLLEELDLEDVITTIRRCVFERGEALSIDRSEASPEWVLSPWGQLTLIEMLAVATQPAPDAAVLRQRLEQVLERAGYALDPTTPTEGASSTT